MGISRICEEDQKVSYIILQLAICHFHYRKESRLITKASMVRACNIAIYFVSINILNFTTFSTYAGSGNILSAKKVFTFISLISFSSLYFVNHLVDFLLGVSEIKVAIQRIQVRHITVLVYCIHRQI